MSSIFNPEEYEPNPAAPALPEQVLPEPATRHEMRTLERLHETYGDAFQAYLAHVWDGTPIQEIENDFRNLYWGSYPDRKAYIDSTIDGLGWKEGYDHLISSGAIPTELLNWNYPLLLERLEEDRELIDHGGKVHVFLR